MINKVMEEQITEKAIEGFIELVYEAGKIRPMTVIFQSTEMMEKVVRKAKSLNEDGEVKTTCLHTKKRFAPQKA